MGKVLSEMRTSLLTAVGGSRVAQSIVAGRCRRFGVDLASGEGALVLTHAGRSVLLHPKHLLFAPEIARRFGAYFSARRSPESETVADFRSPQDLLLVRRVDRAGASLRNADDVLWLQKQERVMLLQPRHFPYIADMAEKFDLYFSPVEPTERDGLLVVNYSRPGILQTYRNSGLQFEMASFPEEEEAIEEYFRWYRPKPGDTVFDMGAHCGISTCTAGQVGRTAGDA